MKPRKSGVEWVAFAAISRFRSPILDTIPTGSFLALRQTFSWCYMPSPDRLRSAPATAGILAPRGNDVTNHVNTGIYARRRKSFWFRKGRGAPGAVGQPISNYFSRTYSSNRETLVMQNRSFFIT